MGVECAICPVGAECVDEGTTLASLPLITGRVTAIPTSLGTPHTNLCTTLIPCSPRAPSGTTARPTRRPTCAAATTMAIPLAAWAAWVAPRVRASRVWRHACNLHALCMIVWCILYTRPRIPHLPNDHVSLIFNASDHNYPDRRGRTARFVPSVTIRTTIARTSRRACAARGMCCGRSGSAWAVRWPCSGSLAWSGVAEVGPRGGCKRCFVRHGSSTRSYRSAPNLSRCSPSTKSCRASARCTKCSYRPKCSS